jgi:hypothetical protein
MKFSKNAFNGSYMWKRGRIARQTGRNVEANRRSFAAIGCECAITTKVCYLYEGVFPTLTEGSPSEEVCCWDCEVVHVAP